MQLFVKNEKKLHEVAQEIIKYAGNDKIWLFEGQLGAGKTTLIKNIGFSMRVIDNMSSPTYSIINEYETASGNLIFHIDCYRLKNLQEAIDIGMEEYLDSGNYCFIEWPEKIAGLLPEHYLTITIEADDDECRTINLKKV